MSGLEVVHRGEEPPDAWEAALFLAGPAEPAVPGLSAKARALEMLREKGYRGVVFVDENKPEAVELNPTESARWSNHWRQRADCIVLWLPPDSGDVTLDLARLGEWAGSGRIVLGVPNGAIARADEVRRWASARRVPVAYTLSATVEHALALLPWPASRRGAERDIPLLVWNTSTCRAWYESHRRAGNQLLEVRTVWTFRVGPGRRRVTIWALHPRMLIGAEGRVMSTEVVFGRADMSALMLYRPAQNPLKTELVLVRDFRPAGRTSDGYLWELPSGSGDAEDPELVGLFEFAEETGSNIDSGRLRYHGASQVWSSGAAHVCHLYSAIATIPEIEDMRAQGEEGIVRGLHEQEEYTYPLVMTWEEILASSDVDWSTKGMIAQVIHADSTR
jgi:hypothetical protein